jgi:hypothetical protein
LARGQRIGMGCVTVSMRLGLRHGLILIWLLAFAGCAPTIRSLITPETWVDSADGIEVRRDGIRFGQHTVKLPARETDLVEALGEYDRADEKENRILVWDRLGIFAYQRLDADVIHAVVSFSCAELDFCPKTAYSGVLVVGDAVFRKPAEPREFILYGFRSDEFFCFKSLGHYQVSVACLEGGPELGLFEIALRD